MKSPAWVPYAGILGLLGGTIVTSALISNRIPELLQRPLAGISTEIAGWKMDGAEELPPNRLRASSYIARGYEKEGQHLGLLIAFHDSDLGAVSIHNPKNCLPGDGWEIWKSAIPTVVFDGRPVSINQYQIYKAGHRKTVLYWYQTRNRVIANEYLAKFLLVRDAALERRTSGSMVRIALSDEPQVLPDGFRFAEAVMHQVQLCFRP
jgi:EpsI family protein